ncbi:hypothetical protein C1Y41_04655 [Pantoea sp. ICBG 1758]|uniref:hypothetical protein n=1 Tax=Pantoea sp. ICBG 1758 TaxID=2071682 RepID=UPI000CE552A1|nr:hypothetical protein [Pantoea sp. ICBG 1758]PPC63937.1 hypothetical protein C1Y41_04655 [Pantoea sp. ICBG 1758]
MNLNVQFSDEERKLIINILEHEEKKLEVKRLPSPYRRKVLKLCAQLIRKSRKTQPVSFEQLLGAIVTDDELSRIRFVQTPKLSHHVSLTEDEKRDVQEKINKAEINSPKGGFSKHDREIVKAKAVKIVLRKRKTMQSKEEEKKDSSFKWKKPTPFRR